MKRRTRKTVVAAAAITAAVPRKLFKRRTRNVRVREKGKLKVKVRICSYD